MTDKARGFTVKGCYEWLCDFSVGIGGFVRMEIEEACIKLGRNDVPSKIAIFAWRLMLDRLATRGALHSRGILISNHDLSYVLCFKEEETVAHMFCECEVSRQIWRGVFTWLGSDLSLSSNPVSNFKHFRSLRRGKR